MASPTESQPTGPSFDALVARFGLPMALQLLRFLDPNASDFSKGLGGAQLGADVAKGAASVSPTFAQSGAGQALPYLGPLLSAAGLGYGLTGIAKSDMPVKKKVGHSVDAGVAAAVPMYGLSKVADYVFGKMQRSGSPQQRRFGQTLAAPTLLPQSLMSVLKGDQSPRAAGSALLNSTLSALGLGGYKPTTGTSVRHEIGGVAGQIPALKGFQMQQDALTIPQYNSYDPGLRTMAYSLADKLGSYAPDYKKNPQAYQIQLGNSLLKSYGNQLPAILQQVMGQQA